MSEYRTPVSLPGYGVDRREMPGDYQREERPLEGRLLRCPWKQSEE